MYTLLNPRDQIEFPNTAFELPGAKRHECSEEQNRERARHGKEERRVTTAPGAAAAGASAIAAAPAVSTGATPGHGIGVRRRHGMLCMFCIDSGIIL
jgi:hypothetical protein